MGNHRDYEPKFLTLEQTAKLDELIKANKQIYFSKKWSQSFLQAFKEEMKDELKKLIDKYFVDNPQSEESREIVSWNIKKVVPKMRMSPEDFWIYRQTQQIREDLDTIMPALQPHQHVKMEDITNNIREEVKILHRSMEKHQQKAEDEGSGQYTNSYPLARFKTIVKIEFFNHLLQQHDSVPKANTPKKLNTNVKHYIGTTSQQTLLIYYLLEYAKLNQSQVDKTKYANLIHFLTGKNHDNIRKTWSNVHKDNPKELVKDLDAIRTIFEGIEAEEVLKMIENDLRG